MGKKKFRIQDYEGIRTIGILPSLMLLINIVPSDEEFRRIARPFERKRKR
jgi:hypothetical protein